MTPALVVPVRRPPDAPAPATPASPVQMRRVSLSEVLGALSYALDLTEGQAPGHVLRSCAIAMHIAEALTLPPASRSALYYAMLLKDAGCSSNAARMAALFASDDQTLKRAIKTFDWQHRIGTITQLWRYVAPEQSLTRRVKQVLHAARDAHAGQEMIAVCCERGADIARRLGFPEETAQAILGLDEHWNGLGYPSGARGEAIPLLSRIANLAQVVEVFIRQGGLAVALEVSRQRSGRWFDPALVRVLQDLGRDAAWWDTLQAPELEQRVAALEPADGLRLVDDEGLDVVAAAFADIIDAKSPYTYRHSTGVADLARGMTAVLGLGADEERRLHRAGLLHDIGKLGVSNRILDKQGGLTPEERLAVQDHPRFTSEILGRVAAFADVVSTAATHHERLNGSGYPWKLNATQLDLPARVLAVADVYEALTADRPYRPALTRHDALEIMRKDCGNGLCYTAVGALDGYLAQRTLG